MHKQIEYYLSHLIPLLSQKGVEVYIKQEIAWGVQLKVTRNSDRATINLYYSEKRGLSQVISAPKQSGLKTELELLLLGEKKANEPTGFHTWQSWIGSDECGKGDYFGPLVACAFYVEAHQVEELKALGVQDSKLIGDIRIVQVAKSLYLKYPFQASCIVLKPTRYNELIHDFKQQGQNLNDLLSWLHEKVILELFAKQSSAEGVIVDQFTRAHKVKNRLYKRNPALSVMEQTHAERDIAVAAASILARYQFLEAISALNRKYKFVFPKGAGSSVIKAGQNFIKEHGEKHLCNVAKLHFKTSQSVNSSRSPDIPQDASPQQKSTS